jgi:hypothetical protein
LLRLERADLIKAAGVYWHSPIGKPNTCVETVSSRDQSLQKASGSYMKIVNAQHRLDRKRWAPGLCPRRMRLDDLHQCAPGHHPIHLVAKSSKVSRMLDEPG